MANQSIPPSYNEEQTTAWLAWLAYNMQYRDLTIFQIENLQPVWLAGRREMMAHLLIIRTLWGILSGLTYGLILGLVDALIDGLIDDLMIMLIGGLSLGLICGLSLGLIEMVKPIQKLESILRTHGNSTKILLVGTITFGLIFGLSALLIFELGDRLITGFSDAFVVGFSDMLVVGLLVELLQWSWPNVYQNARKGLIVGLSAGLSGGAIIGMIIVLRIEN
ncbi:MAG: hypothetical protein AAF702_23275 [Chloroflexota bacterium]